VNTEKAAIFVLYPTIKKLVERFSTMEKSLESKADASRVAQLDTTVMGFENESEKCRNSAYHVQ